MNLRLSQMQDNRVFAVNKFGMFEVPKEFLNTAAVTPEVVRRAREFLSPHSTTHVAEPSPSRAPFGPISLQRYSHMILHRMKLYIDAHTHTKPRHTQHILMVWRTHASSFYFHVQGSNAHGSHGDRRLTRANEPEEQKQKQQQQEAKQRRKQQKAKNRQQQQKQAKQLQQQNGGGETRVSTISTSHGHRFDSELNRLEAEAARRKERLEHKRLRKRKRDRSAHNKRANKRKNLRRSDDRKTRARTRSQMAHVLSELLHPARSRQEVAVTAVQMVVATETKPAVAAAMGCNGREEAGNALASYETVQALAG